MTLDLHILPAARNWGGESVPERDRQDRVDGGPNKGGDEHPRVSSVLEVREG